MDVNQIPKCRDCGQPMIEVGETGKIVSFSDLAGIERGIRSEILYQCPEDKTIAIN